MRWPAVVQACVGATALEPVLVSIYGNRVRAAGSAEFAVPALEYTLIAWSELEDIWEPVILQFDQFVETEEQLLASAQALHRLFNHDVPVAILDVYMWSQYEPGPADLAAPATEGYFGQAIRYKFTPIQERYLR